jgi:DNA (cytosine-5)-methyltransferase 1
MTHSLASEVRSIRHAVGMTQAQLAQRFDVSRREVQRWEAGDAAPGKAVLEILRSLAPSGQAPAGGDSRFTFIDLFAGIGGMRRAFESERGQCVFTSEWDKFCLRTYASNFDVSHKLVQDIRSISSPADIPEHDVLLAGFPCQPFSLAGVSKKNSLGRPHGFKCTTQGTLFFEIERILHHHRPRAFLLENVKHLQSHDAGRTYDTIIERLESDLGYKVFPKVLDARYFVPQHRERIYLVGFRDSAAAFDWKDVVIPRQGPTLRTVLHPEDGSEEAEEPYTCGPKAAVNHKYTLSGKLWKYLRDYAEKHRLAGNGFGYGLVGADDVARTLSARYYKDGSEILVRQGRRNPRRLTPRECARLMGFDTETERFVIPVSDTQAYKQFGNSVAVPVVRAIAQAMVPQIRPESQLTISALVRTA